MVPAFINRIQNGVALEVISREPDKDARAMVLVNEDWGNKLYFVNLREGWSEQDYFDHAEKLINRRK